MDAETIAGHAPLTPAGSVDHPAGGVVQAASDGNADRINPQPVMGMSVYEGTHPGTPITGLDFLMVRASIAERADTAYGAWRAKADAAGIPVIAWHFAYPTPVAPQVMAFLAAAQGAHDYALDVEAIRQGGPEMSHKAAREFRDRIRSSGRTLGIYTYATSGLMGEFDYNWVPWTQHTPPSLPHRFWQHSFGRPNGERYVGDRAAWNQYLAGESDVQTFVVDQAELHQLTIPAGTATFDLGGAPKGPQAQAVQRQSEFLGHLGTGQQRFWVVRLPEGGAQSLHLVRNDQVTDAGAVPSGGASQADLDAARAAGFADAKDKAITAVQAI